MSPMRLPEPPGPPLRDSPRWLGHIHRDVLGAFDAVIAQYGDIAMVRLGPRRMIVFRDADAARHILVTAQDRYPKAENFKLLRVVLGLGLVTSEGEVWRKSRRMVQPLFAKRHLGAYAKHMASAGAAALDRWERTWPADHRIDIDKEILQVGLDTVGRALVTHDFGDRAALLERALAAALDEIGEMSGHPGVLVGQEWRRLGAVRAAQLAVPRRWRRLTHAGATIDSLIAPIVEDRLQNGQRNYDDLVRLLMETVDDETGTRLSTRQVIDEVKTFIAAGHETTAHGLTWMFLLLAENPAVRARVYHEVDTVLDGRRPSAEDVERLPLLQAAFLEAMRIYPPVWAVPRFAADDDQIGNYRIERGSRIMISIWSMHHDPRVFPDPMAYRLERWMDDAEKQRPRLSYMPFGGGRRACIGQGFALLNAAVLGAMMIQRYEFERASTGPIALEPTVTLRPLTGVPMIARRRPQPVQEVSNDAIQAVQA
ncbi:MAG TPA: cytochrome P450 [Solirubrobacteraceae bacterium]|nr:cytochrome P450 [Solirubrobacteraceae bacterium]